MLCYPLSRQERGKRDETIGGARVVVSDRTSHMVITAFLRSRRVGGGRSSGAPHRVLKSKSKQARQIQSEFTHLSICICLSSIILEFIYLSISPSRICQSGSYQLLHLQQALNHQEVKPGQPSGNQKRNLGMIPSLFQVSRARLRLLTASRRARHRRDHGGEECSLLARVGRTI